MKRLLLLPIIVLSILLLPETTEACHRPRHKCPVPTSTPASITPTPTTITPLLIIEGPGNYTNIRANCVIVRNTSGVTITGANIGPCNGNALHIYSSNNVIVSSSSISSNKKATSCCDTGSGILAQYVNGLTIQDSTIRRSETNVQIQFSQNVNILRNLMYDPLGPYPRGTHIQVVGRPWGPASQYIRIEGNDVYTSAADALTTDHFNIAGSDHVVIYNNGVFGPSPGAPTSGCGITVDYDTSDVLVDTNWIGGLNGSIGPQCGFVVGNNHRDITINHNWAINVTNVDYTIWNPNNELCQNIKFSNNIAYDVNKWWHGTYCNPGPLVLEGNNW